MQTTVIIIAVALMLATLVGIAIVYSARPNRHKMTNNDALDHSDVRDLSAAEVFSEPVRRLAKNFAHDVNNSIAIILLNAERLESTASKEDQDSIEQIIQACDSCRMLTHQIQAIGGVQLLKLSPTDFANILEDSRSRFEFLIDNRNWLIINTRESLPCNIDAEAILTAIDCLIQNASQSCHQSKIELSAYQQQVDQKSEIWIEVSNPKLDSSTKLDERCFEPYHTTDSKRRGLGLTYAASIANNHAGRISLQKCDQNQTTVSIVIPGLNPNEPVVQ